MNNEQLILMFEQARKWDQKQTAFWAEAIELFIFDPLRTMIEVHNNKMNNLNQAYNNWKPLEG